MIYAVKAILLNIQRGCFEKLCMKDKISLSDYVALKQRIYFQQNFFYFIYPKICFLRREIHSDLKILCENSIEEAFVTLGLYLTDIERYFHPANFCFCSLMSIKLQAPICDDIHFPNVYSSSLRDFKTLRSMEVQRDVLSASDRFIITGLNFLND